MVNIKRYCKKVDITDSNFIKTCIYEYLDEKWQRNDVARLFTRFSDYSFNQIKTIVRTREYELLNEVIDNIANHIKQSLIIEKLQIRPILYYERVDGMNKKIRIIGVQEPLHQIYDYIAVNGLMELFNARIGVFQCSSLPEKGPFYGKKHIEKWVRETKVVYFIKSDIKQCFPSIPLDKLKEKLKRDVKNSKLLWLVFELLDMFQHGLSIGSYLSQYLSNYYLSYAYHYANENLFKIRKTKHKGNVKVKLINHILFYMDDFLLTGSSKKDLKKAINTLSEYVYTELGLTIKPTWKICKLSDTEPIDMMGFVFYKDRTTIRTKIFLKTRRYYLKANKCLKENRPIPIYLARQCISAFGWYKHTDSHKVREKLNIDGIFEICKKIVSNYDKERSKNYGKNIQSEAV